MHVEIERRAKALNECDDAARGRALRVTSRGCVRSSARFQWRKLIYSPHSNYAGEDGFVFRVNDGEVSSEPVIVSISVADAGVSLLAAVSPASRSVEVGTMTTAFANLINAGSLTPDHASCNFLIT